MLSCVEHAISNIKSGTDDGRILITPSKRGGGGSLVVCFVVVVFMRRSRKFCHFLFLV